MDIPLSYLHVDSNNNNNNNNVFDHSNGSNVDNNKLTPIQKYVSSKLWSNKRSTNLSNKSTNSSMTTMKRRDQHHYQRYRSGSSSDSAITLDSPIDDESTEIKNVTSDIVDDFNQLSYHLITMALEDETFLHSEKFNQMLPIIKVHCDPKLESKCSANCDQFGFIKETSNTDQQKDQLIDLITSINNYRANKLWIIGCANLKFLIREYGVPNELRSQVWMAFIQAKLGQQYDIENLLGLARDVSLNGTNESIIKQIDLDVTRTMPGHIMFSTSIGLSKLRRILIAYCIHVNPFVGYCQAMNFIAALLLLIFHGNEAQSLMGLICIIDHYFPPNYFDEQLTGARSDQLLLRDLFQERLESDQDKALFNGPLFVQITNSLTLNWFLSLFHNAIPWQVRLQILDCFWIEGVKVLFRFSIALIELGREGLNYPLSEIASGEIINSIKERSRRCYDINRLKKLAFRSIKIPKRKHLAARRSFYVKQIINGLDDIGYQSSSLNNLINTNSGGNVISSSSASPAGSSPDEEGRKWLRRKSSGLLRGLTINHKSEPIMEAALSIDNSIVVTIEENGTKDELIVTTLNTNLGQNLTSSLTYGSKEMDKVMIKKVVIKMCQKRRYHLFGVSNDASKIYFYQETVKCLPNQFNDKINIIRINYRVKSAFHDSDQNVSFFVGCNGVVSRIDHSFDSLPIETISLDGRKCTIQSTSYDPLSGQLAIYVNSSGTSKLYILDTLTLDIYNCLYIDRLHHLSLSSSLIFASLGRPNDLETIYLFDGTTIKQPLVQNTDSIVTLKSFLWPPNESLIDLQDNYFSHYQSKSSLSLSTKSISSSSLSTVINSDFSNHLLIVLFKTCRLLCIQVTGNRITRKRSCTLDKFCPEKAFIVNVVESKSDEINVTLFSPQNKLTTVSL